MTDKTYSIIFNGELLNDIRRKNALETVSHFTNISQDELLETLFSIKPIIITQTEDEALALEYKQAFITAGLDVEMEAYDESHDDIINVELSFGHYAPLERTEAAPNYVLEIEDEPVVRAKEDTQTTREKYVVVFEGALNSNYSKQQAISNVCHLTKATEDEVIEGVFSVVPVIIKQTNNKAHADEYFNAFTAAGLQLALYEDGVDDNYSNEELVVSPLTIRNDTPPPLEEKPIPRFSYTLLGISALAVVIWAFIYITYPGLFSIDQPNTIKVELNYAAVEPEVAEEIPELKPEPKPEPKPVPKTKVVKEKPKTVKVKKQPVAKKVERGNQKQLQKAKEDYFITLLNWFAQPQHHGYDTAARKLNLEGEIKIRITIDRKGKLKNTEVLSSTSEGLTNATLESAKKASPYPAMPKGIKGSQYRFVLPLKYQLEK